MFLSPREAAAVAGLSTRAAFDEWVQGDAVRPERRVVEVRVAPVPPARGSFRQLLAGDQERSRGR